eukprot:g7230.t1
MSFRRMCFLANANTPRRSLGQSHRVVLRYGKLRFPKLNVGFRGWKFHSASGASISPSDADEEPSAPQVFPRIRERDPYRLLGLSTEATFEEIQDARNYYYETYRHHDPSREAIELAFDAVLEEHIQKRKKYGFQPAKLGQKNKDMSDAETPQRRSLVSRIRNWFEPAVPLTTIVNDGVIYLLLGCWAAGTQYVTSDPTGPFVVAMGFCAWRLFDKRQKRNPDGPYLGGSPIFGALGTTVLGCLFASIIAVGIIPIIPWQKNFSADSLSAFLSIVVIGLTSIFVK